MHGYADRPSLGSLSDVEKSELLTTSSSFSFLSDPPKEAGSPFRERNHCEPHGRYTRGHAIYSPSQLRLGDNLKEGLLPDDV